MTSPGLSCGTNEYALPSFGQNPSVLPGRPLLLRPTGPPHWPQKRCDSGTSATAMSAAAGSRSGTCGTATRLAPSRPRATVRVGSLAPPMLSPAVLLSLAVPPCADVPPAAAGLAGAGAL